MLQKNSESELVIVLKDSDKIIIYLTSKLCGRVEMMLQINVIKVENFIEKVLCIKMVVNHKDFINLSHFYN